VLDTATLHWDGKIDKQQHKCLVHANESMMDYRDKSYSWVFPVTHDFDWCGEFQPQPEETP
jgi:hypothetical protein